MDSRSDMFQLIVSAFLAAVGIILVVIIALYLRGLLLLVFGATVIAVLIHMLAEAIGRYTPLSQRLSFYTALLAIVATVVGLGWLFGAQVSAQLAQLATTIPAMWEEIEGWLENIPGGPVLSQAVSEFSLAESGLLSSAPRVLGSVAAAVTDIVVVLFGAVFIAANPGLYRRGLTLLFPKHRRSLADEALCESGQALRLWMLGQLVSMVIVGTMTGLGLWLVGVPAPVALGFIMGLLEIIPFLGPILGSIPILIMALSAGPETALLALVVILIVQQAEGNLITPYVQKRAVSLPPALTVFGVIAGGILFGVPGVIFATPLLVVLFVLVKRLYVEEALDTPTTIPGRDT
jgi:predicted PurR-regulated permease PerM